MKATQLRQNLGQSHTPDYIMRDLLKSGIFKRAFANCRCGIDHEPDHF
jgi:hypothetical protein